MSISAGSGLVTEHTIQAMVDKLVADFAPDKVILLGSYAYGTPTKDSDVDLLVIVDKKPESSWETKVDMMAAIYPLTHTSVDLLLCTWPYAQQAYEEYDPIFRPAVGQGKVLYDRQA